MNKGINEIAITAISSGLISLDPNTLARSKDNMLNPIQLSISFRGNHKYEGIKLGTILGEKEYSNSVKSNFVIKVP